MSNKKTFTTKQLKTLSAPEIIDKIKYQNYSLLTTLGAEKLRQEMVPVGNICRAAIRIFHTPTSIAKTLSPIMPIRFNPADFPKPSKNGLVVGFNHPSLGEIPRFIMIKMELMSEKQMLFPVNLPWYESIAKDYEKFRSIGVIITPTITPSTWQKLKLTPSDPMYEVATRLKRDFRNIYTELSIQTVKDGGIIFVATSATRQATVFKTPEAYNHQEPIIPTMSLLALKLYDDPKTQCDFLPVSVLPPKNNDRKINLFKTYQILPGQPMTAQHIRKTYFKTAHPKQLDDFDYDFNLQLTKKLPKKFWY